MIKINPMLPYAAWVPAGTLPCVEIVLVANEASNMIPSTGFSERHGGDE